MEIRESCESIDSNRPVQLVNNARIDETRFVLWQISFNENVKFNISVNIWTVKSPQSDDPRGKVMELSIEWERPENNVLPTEDQWKQIGQLFTDYVNHVRETGQVSDIPTKTGWIYGLGNE